jgi:membrane protein DedA with SNARE-associated domain
MSELISLENIETIAHEYGYWSVFLGIMLENLGIPIPGETITIAGGFLAGSKELNYWFVLGSAIAGASLGGNFGYLIGRLGGWPLLLSIGKIFRVKEEKLEQLRAEFSDHGGKTVFVGRFVALLRIFASPLAGIARMPYLKFMLYNVTGASAWAFIMVTLSFFAGQIIPLPELIHWVAKFAIAALLIFIAWIAIPIWLESREVKE